jgi:periplasmic protein TonB
MNNSTFIKVMKKQIKRSLLVVLVAVMLPFSVLSLKAQENKANQGKEMVFTKVDKMPLFNGKEASEFNSWVTKEIKYPEQAIKQKIIGCVTLSFVVEKDGTVSDVKVLRSVPFLDDEALRVVKSSPKWTPGYKDNIPVRVSFVLPVVFNTTFPSDAKLKVKQ